jgi:hypothetical protein
MDEVDSHDIWQQILRLKILDTDSDSPSVIGNSAKQAEIAPDDELNLDDDDIATLAAAIGKFDIEDGMGTEGAKPKPKRGRPKKRVIQRSEYAYEGLSYMSSPLNGFQKLESQRPWYQLTDATRPIPIPILMCTRYEQRLARSLSISHIEQIWCNMANTMRNFCAHCAMITSDRGR